MGGANRFFLCHTWTSYPAPVFPIMHLAFGVRQRGSF